MLGIIKSNPQWQPLAAAAADSTQELLREVLHDSQLGSTAGPYGDASRGQRLRDQGGLLLSSGPAQAVADYYRAVLSKLMDAALRFGLQVQATAEGAFVLVPGECTGRERREE